MLRRQVLGSPEARRMEADCQRHLVTGWGTYFGESILLLARLQLERRWLGILPQARPGARVGYGRVGS